MTLEDAKNTIPGVLKSVYFALNHGDPQSVGRHIQTDIFQNHQKLDFICQPFSYRAHYIESIVERPNQGFLVRVRALFKPLKEGAYLMYFGFWNGYFYIQQVEEDPFFLERATAVEVARRFIFATRAGEWDVVRELSSPNLDVNELIGADWQRTFSLINQLQIEKEDVQVVSHYGVKLRVKPRFTFMWMLSDSQVEVDPAAGMKVV